jgi:hypothetical protein
MSSKTRRSKRKQLQALDVTDRIIDLADQIRSFYAEKKEQVPTTPDTVHLATATIAKVDVFQTFDGTPKRGLLKLDGNVAGHNLAVKTPFVPQATLDFPPQPSE